MEKDKRQIRARKKFSIAKALGEHYTILLYLKTIEKKDIARWKVLSTA